jgi:hypothetical protein
MWAYRHDSHFSHMADRRTVAFCGLSQPIVPVEVEEVPDGRYWGWIKAGDDRPIMIQPNRAGFAMQFPEALETVAKGGRGRIVRLAIKEIPA